MFKSARRERETYLTLMLITQSFDDDHDPLAPRFAPSFFLTSEYLQERSKDNKRYKSIHSVYKK